MAHEIVDCFFHSYTVLNFKGRPQLVHKTLKHRSGREQSRAPAHLKFCICTFRCAKNHFGICVRLRFARIRVVLAFAAGWLLAIGTRHYWIPIDHHMFCALVFAVGCVSHDNRHAARSPICRLIWIVAFALALDNIDMLLDLRFGSIINVPNDEPRNECARIILPIICYYLKKFVCLIKYTCTEPQVVFQIESNNLYAKDIVRTLFNI